MIELDKDDWEQAKDQAEQTLKQAEIMRVVNENLLKIALKEIAKFPEVEKVENAP